MSAKTKIKLFLGSLLTVLVFYYLFRKLGRSLNLNHLLTIKINWLLAAVSVFLQMFSNYLRAMGYTRGIDPNINRITALQIVSIGHGANMILPLNIGDGLRFAFFPSDYNALRRTKLVMIPALADFVVIITLSLLAVPFSGFRDHRLVRILWILFFICIIAIVLTLLVTYFVPRLRNYFNEFLNVGMLNMVFWVFLSWAALLLAIWIGLVACGFHWLPSLRLSFAVFAATNLVNLIPSSPGAVGLYEYGVIIGLAGLGIQQSTALSIGLVLHLFQYSAFLPMGLVLFIMAVSGKYGKTIRTMLRERF
ncbi:lysylphosphatidylglycerol synthase transmembrane domain-containing protein [Sporolactobacillus vineae]|uniref:lysylphosphatidylglycerol synthase transmembrane domain-containing protein n=1 Tax=Sporolactobacillus vineae TaxID=444463 RepID=UPI000287FF03|nr:lysylphosphatidylglycerol synthase transmembrane domain-containing protein [Sporolactobacillus vineae]